MMLYRGTCAHGAVVLLPAAAAAAAEFVSVDSGAWFFSRRKHCHSASVFREALTAPQPL